MTARTGLIPQEMETFKKYFHFAFSSSGRDPCRGASDGDDIGLTSRRYGPRYLNVRPAISPFLPSSLTFVPQTGPLKNAFAHKNFRMWTQNPNVRHARPSLGISALTVTVTVRSLLWSRNVSQWSPKNPRQVLSGKLRRTVEVDRSYRCFDFDSSNRWNPQFYSWI